MTYSLKNDEELKIIFNDYFDRGILPNLDENEYNVQFKSFKKLRYRELPYIYDINHLCSITNFSSKQQIDLFLRNKERFYYTFEIPKKSGGVRKIDSPPDELKIIQSWILKNILYKLNAGKYAHGFVPGKTICTNAKIHVNQDLVLGIDIKDFFPSIKFNSVNRIFKSVGYTPRVAGRLSDICTYHEKLPQGAPTSPMLANFVALDIDKKISKYCRRRNFKYSRYADDITISGSYKLPMHKEKIIKLIEESKFEVNEKKVRMVAKGSRQKVTGLVVNDKVSIGRTKKKFLRAIVHNILKNGPVAENKNGDLYFREQIFGLLGYAKSVDPEFAAPLIESLKNIDWSEYNDYVKDLQESGKNANPSQNLIKNIFISDTETELVRVATVQLDFKLSNSFPFEIVDEDKSNTLRKIYTALKKANEYEVDIICFPELSFCEEWLSDIRDEFPNLMIIAGSHYNSNKNVCEILFNANDQIPPQLKIKPSVYEKGKRIQKMVPGKYINIYESMYGKFAVLICRDFPAKVPYLRDLVDIIFVPSFNKDIDRFYTAAYNHVQNSPSYIIISNCSIHGGTSIFGVKHYAFFDELVSLGHKRKGDNTYNLCEVRKGKEEMIIADLNILYKSLQVPTVSDDDYDKDPVDIIDRIPL